MTSIKNEFLEMLTKYQGILYKVGLVYFHDEANRKDNFQEIVYQLWKSYPKVKNKNSLGSWIYAVAINTSISKLHKESRIEYKEKMPDPSDTENISDNMEKNEEVDLLLRAIHNLGDIDKTIIMLYLEEKSYGEIARITGMSQSNVGVRINRTKKILNKNLKYMDHGK